MSRYLVMTIWRLTEEDVQPGGLDNNEEVDVVFLTTP